MKHSIIDRILCCLLAFSMVFALCGCKQESTSESDVTSGSFPLTLTDQAGREVTLDKQPETLVSGYYISSSILIALGQADKLVGIEAKAYKRNIYRLAAPELMDLPSVGSPKEFDLEGCAALKPDLIVLPLKLKEAAAALEELGLKALLINPENTEQLYEAIELLGKATGAEEQAAALLSANQQMQSDLSAMIGDTQAPSVYLGGNSSFLSTIGSGMYQNSLIENAGGVNVAKDIEDTYWVEISYEQLLAWNPEVIILAAEASYSAEDVLADSNLAQCDAVKNGRVYAMPKDIEAWDSPLPGSVLGSIWMAGVLHGDKVSSEYYENAVAAFYETYYGFTRE